MSRPTPVQVAFLLSMALTAVECAAAAEVGQAPQAGLIASDEGGAVGYQHGVKKSRFVMGKQTRIVNERGWSKVVGTEGTFATSLSNGVIVATPNAHARDGQSPARLMDPARHNREVLKYFIDAGLPADQLGGIHTTTRLSSKGQRGELRASFPKIDSYTSVVERRIGGFNVPDSVAWAEMNGDGKVVSEGVYWPAIPAKALADARRIAQVLSSRSERPQFLSRLPGDLPPGQIVIRHSSASMQQGPFEAFASYDVVERRESAEAAVSVTPSHPALASTVVRHFDVDGAERRLPQEARNLDAKYPSVKTPPASAPSH